MLPTVNGILQTSTSTTVTFRDGYGFDASGNLCVTSTDSAQDTFQAGKRFSPAGQLVIGNGVPPARPYVFNAGWPSDARSGREGITIAQGGTPAGSDPRIAGVAIGPLGGVYMSAGA